MALPAHHRPRKRFDLLAVGKWVADKAIDNWEKLAALIAAAGATYLGTMQERVRPWGRFEWTLFFLGLALVLWLSLSAGSALLAWARVRRAQAIFTEGMVHTATVNPLRKDFETERIRLNDFYHPHAAFRHFQTMTFRNCELIGPAVVLLADHITFNGQNLWTQSDVIIVKNPVKAKNALNFHSAVFTDCRFFGVTLLVTEQDLQIQ
jgi:hypothetical protein